MGSRTKYVLCRLFCYVADQSFKVLGLICDNASNNNGVFTAIETLEAVAGSDTRVRCICHVFNISVKAVMRPIAKGVTEGGDEDLVGGDSTAEEEKAKKRQELLEKEATHDNEDDEAIDGLDDDQPVPDDKIDPGLDAEDDDWLEGEGLQEAMRSMSERRAMDVLDVDPDELDDI
jgi:hypothetical protein